MKNVKRNLLWFSLFWLLAACASDERQAATTAPVRTATAVPATNTPMPTTMALEETVVPTPSQTPTIIPSSTPSPIPTSAVVVGWLAYHNEYYDYSISYPPEATIHTEGVQGFPTEELPENMTSTAYLNRLRETYPDDICVSISLSVGSVHILAPPEAGGKYADICPGLGIGAYDLVETSETVTVNGQPFTATGFTVHERDEAGTFRSEFFIFSLADGTRITIAVGPENSPQYESDYEAAYADYLVEKELLLQIIDSYRETVLAEESTNQLDQFVAIADKITVGDWSPDGRYFTYWTHTPDDADVFMPGDFYIYDTEQAQSCLFDGYRTGATTWKRRHLWLPDGEILIFGDEDVVAVQPCRDDFAILTDRFPEPITRVVTATADRSHFLLTSENSYWLYQPEGHQVRQVLEFNQGMDGGAAFSPDGRYVALNGDEGDSYLLNVDSATVSQIATWHGGATSAEATPQWINEARFVIISSNDLGPVLIDVDGTRQNVGLAFFDRATPPDSAVYAQRDEQSGQFHLLLEIFDDEEYPLRLFHSENDESEALTAEQDNFMNAVLTKNGRWLLTLNSTEDNGREWWVRPIDPANSIPQRLVAHDDTINLWMAPVGDYVAVGDSAKIELLTLPDATRLATYAAADQTLYPLGFSPDGRFLVIEAVNPDGGETLFIELVDEP